MIQDKVKEIYQMFGDEKSKYIFENRLLYSLTQETRFIKNVVDTMEQGKKIDDFLNNTAEPIGVFGAGVAGKRFVNLYSDIKVKCFIDNYKAGGEYKKLPIMNLRTFKEEYPDGIIVISSLRFHEEMLKQLKEEGIKKEKIVDLGAENAQLRKLQYFDLPQLKEKKVTKEIFIDGGSYDGKTSLNFINWCSNLKRKGSIYAWEPEPKNQIICMENFDKNNVDYQLITKGIWSRKDKLNFKSAGGNSLIDKSGDLSVEVDSVDNLIKEPATFIKLDVEGAEYDALLGAKNMIEKYKPKLAICVYHKSDDIWELPWLIYKINPEYTFYLRHYFLGPTETVLYAI